MSRFSSTNILSAPPVPPPPRLTTNRSRPSTAYQNEDGPGTLSSGTKALKKPGVKSHLGTVIGKRKNAGRWPITPAQMIKKERNRASSMPFRRGDSSKSQQGAESLARTAGRPDLCRQESSIVTNRHRRRRALDDRYQRGTVETV